ncbi:MAG: 5'-nucleotidase C-terminal domain-containing protein [Oscillospiraceae bacterium]|jgi:2',3'-cyclic-nucleotide 2'-phosphodiesterase/3'-nucleotidase|nr:5'-nucleotidase C-terminal domain-containing protein [Oscillospiraceae bacterium]
MRFQKRACLLLALLVAISLAFGGTIAAAEDSTVKQINIYSLNAFHGRLEADRGTPGAAVVSAYIKNYLNPETDILVDAGNYLQGTAVSTATYGAPVVDFYNAIGMTATVVGNHEFDWGVARLAETMAKADFPLLSANIVNADKSAIDWAQPYTLVERDGITIGIIGLINPSHRSAINVDYLKGLVIEDAAEIANALIPKVRAEGADIVVLVGTIGGLTDDAGVAYGDLIDFAGKVQGADAIVGSLHATVSTKVNGVPVVQAYRYGTMLGHIALSYDTETNTVVDSGVEVLPIDGNPLALEADSDVAAIVAGYADELNATYSVTVATLANALTRGAGVESAIGNWVTDSMRESAQTQIAFTNPGGLRADLPAGDININSIYEVMPFPNTVVHGEMTGAQLKSFLEQVAAVGIIPISGVKFTYDLSKDAGGRFVSVTLSDGSPIEDEAVYTVATNNFLAGGTDGYTELANVEWTDTAVLVRDAMIENVKANGTISEELEGRLVDLAK